MIRIKTNPKYSHLEPYLRQLTLEGAFNEGGKYCMINATLSNCSR